MTVQVGDMVIPTRNFGNCMQLGKTYLVIKVKDTLLGHSFFVDCGCPDRKCRETGWWPIESDFKIVPGSRITSEDAKRASSLPSPDDAADFMKRKP